MTSADFMRYIPGRQRSGVGDGGEGGKALYATGTPGWWHQIPTTEKAGGMGD